MSISSADPEDFSCGFCYRTIFFAANILSCMNSLGKFSGEYGCMDIMDRIAGFLLKEISPQYSFNYWSRSSAERGYMPYPDDLDDTSVALRAVIVHNVRGARGMRSAPGLDSSGQNLRALNFRADILCGFSKLLACAEIDSCGSYMTWLVPPSADNRQNVPDVVVNCNIASLLYELGCGSPRLSDFIRSRISGPDISSPYYPGSIIPAYFIASSCGIWGPAEKHLENLEQLILDNLRACEDNLLATSMAVTSIIRLRVQGAVHKAVIGRTFIGRIVIDCALLDRFERMVKRCEWAPRAFSIDPVRDGKKYYAGSAALTAAFSLEAMIELERYLYGIN